MLFLGSEQSNIDNNFSILGYVYIFAYKNEIMKKYNFKKILFFFTVIMFSICSAFAQQHEKIWDKDADKAFDKGDYSAALQHYEKLNKENFKKEHLNYKIGLCYFNLNKFEIALDYFKISLKDKKHPDDLLFYSARALHYLADYATAVPLYRQFLKVSAKRNWLRVDAKKLLMQAASAERTLREEFYVIMLKPQDKLNSTFNDFLGIQNQRYPDKIFFSSDRENNLKIYEADYQKGKIDNIKLISSRYNSSSNDILIAFPDSGYQILIERSGKTYKDNFVDGTNESLSVLLFGRKIDFKVIDCHHYDNNLLFFASDMPGGYGGLDIYAAFKDVNENWAEFVNLGPTINSAYNERSPFITGGSIFYFSSDRPESMGAYDVFYSDIVEPKNPIPLAKPINSEGDDLFFRPEPGRSVAWISSKRSGGSGGFDIYDMLFREPFDNNDKIDSRSLRNLLLTVTNKHSDAEEKTVLKDSIFKIDAVQFDISIGKFEAAANKILSDISGMMTAYPALPVLITGHSDNSDSSDINLLLCLSQTEKAADILVKKGINSERIYLRGCGDQYPRAKNQKIDGSVNELGRNLNNRLEFSFPESDINNITIIQDNKSISPVLRNNISEQYLENIKKLSFKVEIVQDNEIYENSILGILGNASAEKAHKSANISYTIGLTKNFDAAQIILETAKENGFVNAKILAYWNGYPISAADIFAKSPEETELIKYQKYLSE